MKLRVVGVWNGECLSMGLQMRGSKELRVGWSYMFAI